VRKHPVDKLLEQHCYKFAAGLLQLVRFFMCIVECLKYEVYVEFKPRLGFISKTQKTK
jgi:hypothetical protein